MRPGEPTDAELLVYAELTDAERLVYAAAFAMNASAHAIMAKPSNTSSMKVAGYVAVLHLRDDQRRLTFSIQWDLVEAMHASFTRFTRSEA